jgi:hypothetical protein
LEKTGCEHVKAAAQAKTVFSIEDTKEPSTEATLMGGKFYSNVWMKGCRKIADEAIKKNEKESPMMPEKKPSKPKRLLSAQGI